MIDQPGFQTPSQSEAKATSTSAKDVAPLSPASTDQSERSTGGGDRCTLTFIVDGVTLNDFAREQTIRNVAETLLECGEATVVTAYVDGRPHRPT